MLSNLQTTEHITLSVSEGLALLECDARSESVPVLTHKRSIPEHDLLPRHDGGVLPLVESLLRTVNRSCHLRIRRLRHARDEVVRRRIVQVDPLARFRVVELVIEEELRVGRVLDLLVVHRVVDLRSCRRGLQLLRRGM